MGGKLRFDSTLIKCEDDGNKPTHDTNYSYYNPKENKCCTNNNTDCKQIIHTIDHTKLDTSMQQKFKYEFDILQKYVGHNKITYKLPDNNEIDIYKSFIIDSSTKDSETRIVYNFEKYLKKGSFGTVIQYKTTSKTTTIEYIAVKYGDIKYDIQTINEINKNKSCSELVVKYIVHKQDCIIMENVNGTIEELMDAIERNKDILIDILYAIVIAINCLKNIGLYYTDIKLENIFYRNTANGLQIILGDLGSATKSDETSVFCSYKPYEGYFTKPYGEFNIVISTKINTIIWGIGILILQLLLLRIIDKNNSIKIQDLHNIKIQDLYYDKFEGYYTFPSIDANRLSNYVEVIQKPIFNVVLNKLNINSNIIKIINNTLFCNYTQRWTLDRIIDFLNKLRKEERKEQERKEQERLEKERLEKERLEKERLEKERQEKERLEKERQEKERLEKERLEKKRQEKLEKEKERQEKERQEKERQEKEKLEKEKLEKEKLEKEKLEKEKLEKERQEKEKQEKQKQEKQQNKAYFKLNYIITGTTNSETPSDFSPTCKILITCDNLKNLKEEINKIILVKNKKNKLKQDIDIIIKGRFMNNKKFKITGKITHIYPKNNPKEHKFVIKYNSLIINKVNINKEFNFNSLCIYNDKTYEQNNDCKYNT